MKKIGLIGHPVVDEIHTFDGNIIRGYGGVYYNALILSYLLNDKAKIYLATKAGEDIYEDIKTKVDKLGNVNTDNLIKVHQKNNRVKLVYSDRFKRTEFSKQILPYIEPEEIDFSIGFDILLINFVSGRELKYNSFVKIREIYKGLIFLDIHSLLMGFGKKGERILKKRGDWNKWMKLADIVQMNQTEGESIKGKSFKSDKEIVNFAKELIKGNTKISIITLGERGSIIAYLKDDEICWDRIKSYIYEESTHATGCGDAFSSGFVLNYLETQDPVKASIFGSKVGGFKASIKSSEQLEEFKTKVF
ncbi:carbohydrate kinase family protein [candidate division KSB1 bacterium]